MRPSQISRMPYARDCRGAFESIFAVKVVGLGMSVDSTGQKNLQVSSDSEPFVNYSGALNVTVRPHRCRDAITTSAATLFASELFKRRRVYPA